MIINPYVFENGAPPFTAILDSLSTAPSAAYSTRKLLSSYAGSCLRIQRHDNGNEEDIGFDSSGLIDIATMMAFLGGSIGQAIIWYDQSGNGYDISGPIDFVAGSTYNMLNGVPALSFATGTDAVNSAANVSSLAGWTANAVAKPTTYSTGQQSVIDQDNYPNGAQRVAQFLRFSTTAIEAVPFDTSVNAYIADSPNNSPTVLTGICSTTSVTAYGDGAAGTPVSISGTLKSGAFSFRIGQSNVNGGAIPFTGSIAEVIMFASPISTADRHTLERNQGTVYGVTVA